MRVIIPSLKRWLLRPSVSEQYSQLFTEQPQQEIQTELQLSLPGEEINMDPVTATMNAIYAFFNFASTPAGQQILADIRTLNSKVNQDIANMIAHVGNQVQPKGN